MRKVCVFFIAAAVFVFSSLAFAQDTNFNSGPQYLLLGSPILARSLATPSYSLAGPPPEIGAENATTGLHAGSDNQDQPPFNPDAQPSINLFPIFYGKPATSVIEISFSPETNSRPIPSSILDAGVQVGGLGGTPQQGNESTLAEAARVSRRHSASATRVYTNVDLEGLHTGN